MSGSSPNRDPLGRARCVKARIERGEDVPFADVAGAAQELKATISTLRRHVGKRTPRA